MFGNKIEMSVNEIQKIKVSKELAKAIEYVKGNGNFEDLLKTRASKDKFVSEIYKPFNEIGIMELAEILINGYQVEETPEDELLQYHQEWKVIHKSAIKVSYDDGYIKGVLRSIESTLNILNIKIKGINE